MRISAPKRGRRGSKRLDLTDIRHVLRDTRVWAGIGVVTTPEGAESHWDTIQVDGVDADIIVDVVLHPSETPVTCRVLAGVWDIPDEGDEVAVLVPEGHIDFMPVIVGRLSSNHVPTAQGPQPGRIVIERDEVLVHDGDGGAQALANETYRSHEDTLITAIRTAFAAINTYAVAIKPVADPSNAATPALTTALTTTFQAAVTAFNAAASTYLTTVLKGK